MLSKTPNQMRKSSKYWETAGKTFFFLDSKNACLKWKPMKMQRCQSNFDRRTSGVFMIITKPSCIANIKLYILYKPPFCVSQNLRSVFNLSISNRIRSFSLESLLISSCKMKNKIKIWHTHRNTYKHTRTPIRTQGLTLLGNDDYISFLRDPKLSLVLSVRLLEQYWHHDLKLSYFLPLQMLLMHWLQFTYHKTLDWRWKSQFLAAYLFIMPFLLLWKKKKLKKQS